MNIGSSMNRHIRRKFVVHGDCNVPFSGRFNSNRGHIAELFREFGYKVGAEIGVKKGEFSKIILNANPGIKFYAIDPWNAWSPKVSRRRQERYYEYTKQQLAPYDVTILRKNSVEALADIPDGSLDFVYIDAIHEFDYVMTDLINWSRKVRQFGIVSGHDFSNKPEMGVIPATYAYTRGHNIFQWFVTRDVPDLSFFWVRP